MSPMVAFSIIALCLVSLMKPAESCFGATLLRSGGLSCQEKHNIVDLHNRLRQAVALGQVGGQPSASNMLQMAWDEELAQHAQRWADRCVFEHDSNNERKVARFFVGQNLAVTWSSPSPTHLASTPDFDTQIRTWFNEVYQYRGVLSHGTGHYTQMIWSDTYLIGCGYSYYLEGSKYTKLYVCNYGPGGNIRGYQPYRRGSPSCSLYGTSPSRAYHGLCEVHGIFSNPCYFG